MEKYIRHINNRQRKQIHKQLTFTVNFRKFDKVSLRVRRTSWRGGGGGGGGEGPFSDEKTLQNDAADVVSKTRI